MSALVDYDHAPGHRAVFWNIIPTVTDILPGRDGGVITGGAYSTADVDAIFKTVRSVEAWIKFTSAASMSIVSHRNGAEHFALYHHEGYGLRLTLARAGGGLASTYDIGYNLNDGDLHHVVANWTDTDFHVYTDGVQVATNTHALSASTENGTLYVASESGGRYWDGQIGHVALYDTPLDESRITAHYELGST